MRDQYYGDRKDVWKWTVVAREASRISAARVIYVAMMRPNSAAEAGHGGNFGPCAGALPKVTAFIESERRDFGLLDGDVTRPYLRRVARISALSDRINVPIAYVGALYRANDANR